MKPKLLALILPAYLCTIVCAAPPPSGTHDFIALSNGQDFDGWKHSGNWVMEDGAFARVRSGGNLVWQKGVIPDDFELRFEWKVSKGCNSGVYYRPGQVEYQILDDPNSPYGENP